MKFSTAIIVILSSWALFAALAGIFGWFNSHPVYVDRPGPPVRTTEIKEVTKWVRVPRSERRTNPSLPATPPVPVQIIEAPTEEEARRFQIEWGITDTEDVVATGDIGPSPYGAKVVTALDRETGEAEIIYKAKPRPTLSFGGRGMVWFGAEVLTEPRIRAELTQQLGRYKDLHAELRAWAERDLSGDSGVGVGVFGGTCLWGCA